MDRMIDKMPRIIRIEKMLEVLLHELGVTAPQRAATTPPKVETSLPQKVIRGNSWSKEDDKTLVDLEKKNIPRAAIAKALGRSISGVNSRHWRLVQAGLAKSRYPKKG